MTPLKRRILDHIKQSGPMSVASYMSWCLLDPVDGYYPTRDPLGLDGDFITAPEISQMFGEVLGLWLLQAWRNLGSPAHVNLVEYGPGRGVMMADILRTARLDKRFLKALNIHLIEPSSALEGKQAQQLGHTDVPVEWIKSLGEIPSYPTIVIGNEYLDCLPIRQFIMKDRFKGAGGWHERMIDIDPKSPDTLLFTLSLAPISKADHYLLPTDMPDTRDGDLLELNPGFSQLIQEIKDHQARQPTIALFIDYGETETEFGDTFQAIKRHEKTHPLEQPGHTDLTARVNFAAFAEQARRSGFHVFGPCPQGQFLSRLGIEVRAVSLSKQSPDAKAKIARQLHRITHSDEMGTLFKAVCLQSEGLPPPLGFSHE